MDVRAVKLKVCLFSFNSVVVNTRSAVYRDPNSDISYFTEKWKVFWPNCRVLITGDLNIDLIKSKIISYPVLPNNIPYVEKLTLHYDTYRIASDSATCSEHVFFKVSERAQFPNITSGLFYYEYLKTTCLVHIYLSRKSFQFIQLA